MDALLETLLSALLELVFHLIGTVVEAVLSLTAAFWGRLLTAVALGMLILLLFSLAS
ncbi:MAG: hypothetical protein R3F61_04830 [Myxococcota bacterium]